jgi:cob(I)alamin adenosyltransferase
MHRKGFKMFKKGLIQVYTGTTGQFNFAPMGLSLRAAGHGLRVHLTNFLSHHLMEGLAVASTYLKPSLRVDHSPSLGEGAISTFHRTKASALAGESDIVIVCGVSSLISRGLVSLEEVLQLIEDKPAHVELIFSGVDMPEAIMNKAHLITEMSVSTSDPVEKGLHPGTPGAVEVVTGNGKGKTTYCLGKAMLSACMGLPCAFLQFIKSPRGYGEVKAIQRLPNLEIKTMGEGFLYSQDPGEKKRHRDAARLAWEHCLREIFSLKYGLVVLDEINTATHYGLVNPDRVREMLFLKPRDLQIILSGRNAHEEVLAAAPTVIELKEIKHPFKEGIKARKGIEF